MQRCPVYHSRIAVPVAVFGSIALSLFFAQGLALPPQAFAQEQPKGLWVHIGQRCGSDDYGDDRTVVLQLFADKPTRINIEEFNDRDIPPLLQKIMMTRAERVLRVVVEDDVAYGRVVDTVSRIKAVVPNLAVMLLRNGRPEDVMQQACFAKNDRGVHDKK